MKNIIRIISFALVLVLCITALIGCATEKEEKETSNTTVRTYSDAELRAMEKDNLPDWVSEKYQGRTIKTISFQENFELDTNGNGEITGDVVHDLVYKRNMSVEERLGITIENYKSSAPDIDVYASELNVMGNSGSDEYDIIYTMGNSAIRSNCEYTYFSDTSQYEYLSLDSPWWNKKAMIEQSFDGKTFPYLVGDITITTYTKAGAIFVNSQEYNNRYSDGLDGLYDLVIDGKWTIDVLAKKAMESYTDVNGDGVDVDDNGDFIGFGMGSYVRLKAMEYGFDVKRYSRDDDGYVKIDYDLERASVAVDKLIELLYENPGVYYDDGSYLYAQSFARGDILFYENQLGNMMSGYMRGMEEDFGVLPTPKLDENQKEYTTEIQESSTFVVIPITCKDTEFTSIVIEALCAESYRTVVYPFLEECMKIQYVRESRAGQIIDIILESATKDYFGLHETIKLGRLIQSTVRMEVNMIASNYASLVGPDEQTLKELKEKYFN